jgi:hypothetical protein
MSSQSSQNQVQQTNQVANATTANASATNPWSVQSPFLTQGFSAAANALNAANAANGPTSPTNFSATFTPSQMAAFQSQLDTGGALTGAGAAGVGAGLSGLAGYQAPTAQGVLSNASMFANNPQLAAMVGAANQPIINQITQQTLPQIDRTAAMGGNSNSSRTGVAQGMAEEAEAQGMAANSANIYGNAWNSGLNTALGLANTQQQGTLGALTGLVGGGTGAVGAGGTLANSGSTGILAGNQAPLTNQLQAWQFGQQSPFAGVNQYMPLVQGNYGGTTTSSGTTSGTNVGANYGTTTNNPSTLAQAGQWGGILSSLFPSTPRAPGS